MTEPLIKLVDLTKEFNGQVVLRGIDLEIDAQEFVTFLGPSGCGKTTTLRIIGGFVEPSQGDVLFQGKSILGIPSHKRPTNTVFQRYALFPHLDVYDNVAFGLRVKQEALGRFTRLKDLKRSLKKEALENNWTKETLKQTYQEKKQSFIESIDQIKLDMDEKVRKYLKLVGLEGYENRRVHKLSGGQQQRVAIARALINEPKVLLLDEPLAALDLKLRQEMQYELKEIQRRSGITFVFVTHDQEEALTMSDKIVVMNHGEIQQVGTPVDIYNEPINKFVATFIGESNIIEGVMKTDFLVHFDHQDFTCVDKGFGLNEEVDIVIRPEDIDIVDVKDGLVEGIVVDIVFKGVHYEIDVETKDRIYTIHTTDVQPLNKKVGLSFLPEDIHVMERSN
ncbi:MAG TPA: spermidine/putrescine ABC transporter ATP-binding protein [Acholeplasmataceae bacterium]|nr:spermidine/putrescine ABC transporter ATP-binding protein [Acholeplasmataceae bacterium]